MDQESFLPPNYEAPTSGGYTKLEQGETRLRILSSPLMVWVVWANGKPQRLAYDRDKKPALPAGDNPSVKHAWLMTVYNYGTSQIEIFELDKMSIITPLSTHASDKDWGHPKHYDITITRSGSGKEGTKYAFVAKPKTPVSEEVKEAYFATPVDLSQLLVPDGNPFLSPPENDSKPAQAAKAAQPTAAQAAQASTGPKDPPF